MCYSKELSLLSGSTMAAATSYFWWKYVYHLAELKVSNIKEKVIHLRGFLMYIILAYAVIGGHQFGEFFSLALQSDFIYKVGLISSVSCTYFLVKALEKLTKLNFYSWVVGLIIIVLSVVIFITPMEYENMKFWIRGYDHRQWSITWTFLFVYFWFSVLYVIKQTTSKVNRKLLWYLLGAVNISFLFSIIYALVATYFTKAGVPEKCSMAFVSDFAFGRDFPSIWCTSSFIQVPFYVLFLNTFVTQWDVKATMNVTKLSWKVQLGLVAATCALMYFFFLTMPLFFAVSWRHIAQ